MLIIIIIIDNFCIALFSGVPKLTALYNILQHFLSFTNLNDVISMTIVCSAAVVHKIQNDPDELIAYGPWEVLLS